MKRCRGQFPCEKKMRKERKRLHAGDISCFCDDNAILEKLPKNIDKPITIEQMKRNGHILF